MPRRGSSANRRLPRGSPAGWRPTRPAHRAAREAASCPPATWPYRCPAVALPAAWWLRAPEVRRALLRASDLTFDDVLAAPRPLEQLFVHRPLLLVGTVVVENPLGVLQRQRRKPGDLRRPLPSVGQRPDPVGHPGLQRGVGGQFLCGQQHRPRAAIAG